VFQRFTHAELVRHAMSRAKGQLTSHLLTEMARQFGQTASDGDGRTALRTAILDTGGPDDDVLKKFRYEHSTEEHDRGAVLVTAVFEAFRRVFDRKTERFRKIAGPGEPSPALIDVLADEARDLAGQFLNVIIRAVDYCPPVDITFGEFLRAIITADTDLIPVDPHGYRIAMIEAFRRRGIVPEGCLSLAPDSLLWENYTPLDPVPALTINDLPELHLDRAKTRDDAARIAEQNRNIVQNWIMESDDLAYDRAWQEACGVIFRAGLVGPEPNSVMHWPPEGNVKKPRYWPKVEVHSVRTTRRTGPDGQDVRQLVIEVTQRRRGFFGPDQQRTEDEERQKLPAPSDFTFRGGATLIFDMFSGKLRYTIRKRITDDKRLKTQRDFLIDRATGNLGMAYAGTRGFAREPFAMVHRGGI
jgi:hypothetical protein